MNCAGKNMIELLSTITLSKTLKQPLYIQLYEKLKEMISDGILTADLRLPSIRQMAAALEVNQITIVSAYSLLENEGYAYSRAGSGTYIKQFLPVIKHENLGDRSIISDELYDSEDLSIIHHRQIKVDQNTINFASATPTPDLFPVDDFKCSLNEVLERDKGNAFEYQDSQGFYPLRECAAQILQKSFITGSANDIQIISGAQQGIDIISKALLRQGDFIITESPTYTGAIAVFKSRGAEINDIEMDKEGLNLDILEYNLKKYKPKLIYIIPSFQNPTGYSYNNYKRSTLLKFADKYNFYIIEDDYVSDLDFTEKNFTPLKAMDKNNRVIFIKSFSKLFMPGLRLGFMIAPPNLQQNILEAKHTTDISTSGLIQRAFDFYVRNGFWDKHFQFMYEVYKERYFQITASLDRYLPKEINYTPPGGGLNLWLDMPYGFPVNSLLKLCASENLVFAPGKIFYSSNTPQKLNNIRLSFAAVNLDQIDQGIQKLCNAIDRLTQKQGFIKNMPIL